MESLRPFDYGRFAVRPVRQVVSLSWPRAFWSDGRPSAEPRRIGNIRADKKRKKETHIFEKLSMSEPDEDLTEKRLKVVLVGDSAAGKTSIAVKFCNDEFSRQYTPTAGIDFFTKSLSLGCCKNVNLHLWDVGGLALHGTMLDKYIFHADLVLLVYDVTNSSSFDILEEWITAIQDINDSNFQKKPLMVLVGNKCDMEHQRTVKREKSHRFAAENSFSYYDMSARTGESVSLCIANLAAKVLGVQLTRMDQELHKPIVIAEIGDTVDMACVQRVVKRYPNKKGFHINGGTNLPLSKSSVCCLQ